jgi:hypothetical protein
MEKSEFLNIISKCNRDEINKILHEKCKPVKLIYPVVRLKGKEEDKK